MYIKPRANVKAFSELHPPYDSAVRVKLNLKSPSEAEGLRAILRQAQDREPFGPELKAEGSNRTVAWRTADDAFMSLRLIDGGSGQAGELYKQETRV